jgi:hypothetical protein
MNFIKKNLVKGEKMKSKRFLLGLLAITLVFGMMVTGCGDKGATEVAKKLTITGIKDITTTYVDVYLLDNNDNLIAGGTSVRSETVTIDLKQLIQKDKNVSFSSENWTGKGVYAILLFETTGADYEFGKTNAHYVDGINFQNETTTVAYSKFVPVIWEIKPSIHFNFSVN